MLWREFNLNSKIIFLNMKPTYVFHEDNFILLDAIKSSVPETDLHVECEIPVGDKKLEQQCKISI